MTRSGPGTGGAARGTGLGARLDELIGLILALEERSGLELRDQRGRDRAVGQALEGASPIDLLRGYVAQAPGEAVGHRVRAVRGALRGVALALFAIGLLLGWAAAAALLSIEFQAGRINVVLALVLLVAIPFLMTLLASLGALFSFARGEQALPSIGGLLRREGLGRLTLRLLPAGAREDVRIVLGRMQLHERLYGTAERGQLLVWSQLVGLGFGAGTFVAALAFVVFTDLAFGWSTTLDVAAHDLHRVTSLVSAPWAPVWPVARPSLELVEATRFFRVAPTSGRAPIDPLVYGGWWPFLVMTIAVYGVLPRVLALGGIALATRREIARAMLRTADAERLVERLRDPWIEGQAPDVEAPIGRPTAGHVPAIDLAQWLGQGDSAGPVVLRWAEAISDDALTARLGRPPAVLLDVGGRCSLADDEQAIRRCGERSARVLLVVRAYEPPLLELLDLLAVLRKTVGTERAIAVLAVGGREEDATTWQRRLAELADPGLRLAWSAEGAAHG